jgi:hypothetical protein
MTPVQANKIVASLLNPKRRFPFDTKVVKFAIKQTIRNMQNPDGRISNAAVANLVKMEKLNQNDDLARLAAAMGVLTPKAEQPHVNVSVGVQIVESDDWYGTRAAAESRAHIAQGNGASTGSAALPGPVQSGGLWPPVGQDGNGVDGDD